MICNRESGILLHISSLPSEYGIGCFSEAAYRFVDRLCDAGQKIWQILPIGQTGFGDSPYQSFSVFAGNPYFISLEELIKDKLLTEEECKVLFQDGNKNERYVDYEKQYRLKYPLLFKAFKRFKECLSPDRYMEQNAFFKFMEENSWLKDYSLFMALKDENKGLQWTKWDEKLKNRDSEALKEAEARLREKIEYYSFIQYLFFKQLKALKSYANKKGIRILGDIPIYVSLDSADCWVERKLFQINGDIPVEIAGCPPDAFAEDGQLWGNPLYEWDYHEKTGFSWWIKRIEHNFQICDILRIDHFRGFDEYFSIPYGSTTAKNGKWRKGPGIRLFNKIRESLGDLNIIAEDLGYVTDSVKELVKETGFPGMKVFEFAFDSRDTGQREDYLPHNYPVNSVAYTGTHDNETFLGWLSDIKPEEKENLKKYICFPGDGESLVKAGISQVMRSRAGISIIPMQDILCLGKESRMNTPSTNINNWKWRMLEDEFNTDIIRELREKTILYGRYK